MEGGGTVRERGGAEMGWTVDTGMVIEAGSKDTDFDGTVVTIMGGVGTCV